ncbi:recombinase family protein [Bacillus subtilis]|uniref:recombinase family protein n=1 Tax=Bacillus subtilis TaxID=1423 RepID=UPI0011A1224B|nr:recombinase family protein [Bacillus subtilis]TWG76373.1 DNA invertase Pin-like site-specific DNA recombinase [Bacillus subtilis J27]
MVEVKLKKVIAYARVSSESQIENTSIEEQLKKIQAYCISQDLELVNTFVDEGLSGSNTDRSSYTEMIEYISNAENEVSGVVVLKADRIHRRLKNLLIMIEDILEPNGIAFISVSEKFDTSTAQGMLFLQMIGSFGEFERKVINERTKGGRISTAMKNKYAGGQVPYGYIVINGQVKQNKEHAAVVKEVFDLYLDGKSYNKIATILNNRNVPTRKGGKWHAQQIKNMINTESYTGFNRYHGSKEKNDIKQKDVFPRIISRQTWNKVIAAKTKRA